MTPEYCAVEWLQLHPKGIVFEGSHFVFILEDESQRAFLPLRFPLASADLLGLPNIKSLWRKSLSTVTDALFKQWNIEPQRCVFVKQNQDRHRVKIFYKKDGEERFFEQDLENILGLCLESELPFYATRAYMQDAQIDKNEFFIVNQKWTDGRQKYLM